MIKILLMGDKGVGKSTIKDHYTGTTGPSLTQGLTQADIKTKTFTSEEQTYKLQLWDVDANFEKIMLMDTNIFSGVHGLVLVFDVTNIHTLNYIRRIYPKLVDILNSNTIPAIIVGNKTDKRSEFEVGAMHVSYEKGLEIANELSKKEIIYLRIPYFEGSNKDPESYEIIFKFITTKLLGLFS